MTRTISRGGAWHSCCCSSTGGHTTGNTGGCAGLFTVAGADSGSCSAGGATACTGKRCRFDKHELRTFAPSFWRQTVQRRHGQGESRAARHRSTPFSKQYTCGLRSSYSVFHNNDATMTTHTWFPQDTLAYNLQNETARDVNSAQQWKHHKKLMWWWGSLRFKQMNPFRAKRTFWSQHKTHETKLSSCCSELFDCIL